MTFKHTLYFWVAVSFLKPGIDDEAEKVFSSNLKGEASKNFSGCGAPRPSFSLSHFSMNPVIGD